MAVDYSMVYKVPDDKNHYVALCKPNSQGAKQNFTYLFEGQVHFALKLSVGCPI